MKYKSSNFEELYNPAFLVVEGTCYFCGNKIKESKIYYMHKIERFTICRKCLASETV